MTTKINITETDRVVACDRLQWLKICYYVYGGMTALFSTIFIFHFLIFTTFAVIGLPSYPDHPTRSYHDSTEPTQSPDEDQKDQEVKAKRAVEQKREAFFFRLMFGIFGCLFGFFILIGWTIGGVMIYAGRCIARRKKQTLIQVMAVISCVFVPIGTLLGVMTFLAFSTPAVKAEFSKS